MSTLQIIFIAMAASLIVFWFAFALRKPPAVGASDVLFVMRYGSTLRVAALVLAWMPPAVMIYAVAGFSWRDDMTLLAAGVLFLATSIIAGLLLIETERVQIAVGENGMVRYSPWTGRASLAWSELECVTFSRLNRWLIIRGAGRTIRVSQYLVGIAEFADDVRRKLATERFIDAKDVLDAWARTATTGRK